MRSIGKVARSCGVHSGEFHADEVTACALLIYFGLIDEDKIVRTRELAHLESCEFVCDVGGEYNPHQKRFDHHQISYDGDLSSAGMVLQYLREQSIITPVLYAYLNRVWVAGVDAIDNGRLQPIFGLCTFSTMISGFVPADHELGDMDKAFFEALTFALGHLERIEKKFAYTQSCKVEVARVMQEMDACLVFDRAMPWIDAFFELDGEHHPAEFVIMPSGPHWKLRGIPPSFQKQMDVRRPMPKTWAGLSREALREKSGIGGAVFCHKGRFISIWETKEDAIHALKKVLELS